MATCSLTALRRGRRGRCHREWQGKGKRGGGKLRKPKTKQRAEPKTKAAKRLNNQTLTKICEIGASSNS